VHPYALAVGASGSVFVVDVGRDEVLRLSRSGRFRVLAGDGHRGFRGDDGPAVKAQLNVTTDSGIAVARDGAVYIADSGNGRVREVRPDGTIVTVAGGGTTPLATGAVAARAAKFGPGGPTGLTIGPDGKLFIASSGVYRLSHGSLDWVVGTRAAPPPGWGGVESNPAIQQDFDPAVRLAFDGHGDLLVAGGGGYGLYERTAAGQLRVIGNFRGDGQWGSLASMPDGNVLLAARGELAVFHPSGAITPVRADLNAPLAPSKPSAPRNVFVGGDGAAVGPTGTVYLDTNSGNSFTSISALIELPAHHADATAAWRSSGHHHG
jgi:hypothetical protein